MMEEEVEQKMTFVLGEIDAQFCKAHESATQLLRIVRRHSQTTRQMHAHCMLFQTLFEQLQHQATPPARANYRHSLKRRQDSPNENLNESALTDAHEAFENDEHFDSFLEDDFDELELKTTTLAHKKPTSTPHQHVSNDSNISTEIASPAMLRTPFLRKASVQPTPPSRTDTNISIDMVPTPEMPSLSNRMQLNIPRIVPEEGIEDNSLADMSMEAHTPDIPNLTRTQALEVPTPAAFSSPGSYETSSPQVQTPTDLETSAIEATTSPRGVAQSPQWQPTPGTNDLRRRFSVASSYHTPKKSSARTGDDEDDVELPSVDSPVLASPLLSTKLKVITPHTPLSNRIAGATTQTPYRSPYIVNSPSTPHVPIFDLALFPVAFQKGEGAYHMTRLYSLFRNNPTQAMTLDELVEKLNDCESERVEILLDTLVSRRLLRPFVVEGEMYWQASFK